MRAKSLALITPNNSVHHFLSIEGMDQIEVLYLDDLKIKLRTFLVSPWKVILCLCKEVSKCKYSSILRKENNFKLKVLK